MIACSDIRHDASEGDHGRYRLTDIQMTAEQSRSRPSREQPRASNFWTFESIFCISRAVSVFCPRDEVTARCGRRLDVFDWGHGGAGRRRYWTLSKRLTILKIYSVTSYRLCQKGSQYVAIAWELDTIGDFTPQDPFPCVSVCCPPTITFNQHPKHICNPVELIYRINWVNWCLEKRRIIVTKSRSRSGVWSIRGLPRDVFAPTDQGKGWPLER